MHWPIFIVRRRCALALLIAAVLAPPAGAVVIATGSDAPNLVAPGNDPGWLNVGRIAGASGVYLGNRWVITANHVSRGPLRLSDGREFAASVGSGFQLRNPGTVSFGSPDLRMFRLAEDPGLPALEIADTLAPIGSQVIMIGAGSDRAPRLTGWQTGFEWIEVSLRFANAFGYSLESTSQMRWGVNRVGSASSLGSDSTFTFSTRFDQLGIPFEAQAAVGDSGGGVFHFDGAWELTGIMVSTQRLLGQPDGTVVYGDQTFVADLSVYGEQILGFVNRDEPLWQNQVNYFDVSGSGRADPRDLLLIANELQRAGSHDLEGAPGASDWLFDVNGDYSVSASDANALITGLLGGAANPAAAPAAGMNFVPEPSSAALAILGSLLIALLAARRARAGY